MENLTPIVVLMSNVQAYRKQYYQKHKEEIKARYEKNRDDECAKKKQYYQDHKEERKAYARKHRRDHKEKINAAKRKYCEENKEKVREQRKRASIKLANKNPHYHRNRILEYNYGITIEQYQKMWDSQNGLCAICSGPETVIDPRTKKIRWLSVDHDHETGEVRALLCSNCNHMIGLAGEDSETLRKAVEYLEKHRQ